MSRNRIVVVHDGILPDGSDGYIVEEIKSTLKSFTDRTGAYIGIFPSLLDVISKSWVHIESGETVADAEIKLDALIQDRKNSDQKVYENKFFLLCKDILTAVNDPRAADTPTYKLNIDEISNLLEIYTETNFNDSIKYSLRLLSIDAALKRFDPLWWDNAISHSGI